MTVSKKKAIILSVGGTEKPLVTTILHHRPEFVSFFASQKTQDVVTRVADTTCAEITFQYETTLLDNENDLLHCHGKAGEAVARVISRGYDKNEIVVDYTGGTKNMSVALALAAIGQGCSFSYVGGTRRTKGGVGIVETGQEKMYASVNPWDFMAVEERKQAVLLFNSCQYKASRDILHNLAGMATKRKAVYRKLGFVIDAFYQWDLFRHQEAFDAFKRGRIDELAEDEDTKIACFASTIGKMRARLEAIISSSDNGKKPCLELSHDLFANADRRFSEGKIDDAILRLYRLVEMLAQERLLNQYGIDTSNVKSDQIPQTIREQFVHDYGKDRDRLKIPQNAAFLLLKEFGDKLGLLFMDKKPRFQAVQSARNDSYLAHGFKSSKEKTYESLREFVIGLNVIDLQETPVFPVLDL